MIQTVDEAIRAIHELFNGSPGKVPSFRSGETITKATRDQLIGQFES